MQTVGYEAAQLLLDVLNAAVTDWALFIVTVQDPLPAQAPAQPPKIDPDAAVAVNVTVVPAA
jgi:hypothetical protein